MINKIFPTWLNGQRFHIVVRRIEILWAEIAAAEKTHISSEIAHGFGVAAPVKEALGGFCIAQEGCFALG
jgi:hypothetical protein